MKLSVKRKLNYAFTIEEIELSTTKKLCIAIPRLLPVLRPILHTPTYQTDVWQVILSKCDIQHVDKTHSAILNDIKIVLTLSETCLHFKDFFDRGLTKLLLDMFWVPDIYDYLFDCCQFFGFWYNPKIYGTINKILVIDYIQTLNLRRQYYIIRLIKEIYYMIRIESSHVFSPTKPDYESYFKCCKPKEVIEKKWIHFMNLLPDQSKIFPKTK